MSFNNKKNIYAELKLRHVAGQLSKYGPNYKTKTKNPVCVIFGFCRGVNDVLALLGCYAAMTGSYLPTFRDSLPVHTIPYTTTHPTAPGPLLVLLYRCRWDAEVVPKRPKISINPAKHIRRGKDFKIRVR